MSWPVRSKRLGLWSADPGANTFRNLGTVPAGKTWLFKEWTFYNASAGTKSIFIIIRIGGVSYVIDAALALASGSIQGNPYRHTVLNAGEELGFQCSVAGAVTVSASGAQLG